MIGEISRGSMNEVEIGPGEYPDDVAEIDLEGAIGDGNVMIDYFHDEPRLYVYDEREEPVFGVRFPTEENDIDSPEVIH